MALERTPWRLGHPNGGDGQHGQRELDALEQLAAPGVRSRSPTDLEPILYASTQRRRCSAAHLTLTFGGSRTVGAA